MCGRVVQKTPLGEIRVLFETVNPVPNAAPTYNVLRPMRCPSCGSIATAGVASIFSDGGWFLGGPKT